MARSEPFKSPAADKKEEDSSSGERGVKRGRGTPESCAALTMMTERSETLLKIEEMRMAMEAQRQKEKMEFQIRMEMAPEDRRAREEREERWRREEQEREAQRRKEELDREERYRREQDEKNQFQLLIAALLGKNSEK